MARRGPIGSVPFVLGALTTATIALGCASDELPGVDDTAFAGVVADDFLGVDRWEVVICRVPDQVRDSIYTTSAERLDVDSVDIVNRLGGVSEYFARWSRGRYAIEWSAASDVAIDEDENSYDCADRALDASAPSTNGVLVVADAQHAADAPGGWGRRGATCERPCAARESRRAAYVGASDFVSYWGDDSPLDLIEHEIGHALGWPHSASSAGVGDSHVYDSTLDVMSNSAAPRDVDPTRRHAPGVLAFNAWLAGWLDDSAIVFVDLAGVRPGDWQDAIRLVASDSGSVDDQVILMVIDLGASWLTVEMLADRGDNDHLPESGIVVHEVVFEARAPEGRWHVVQAVESDGSFLLEDMGEWTAPNGELSIRVGEITDVDGVLGADVRLRRESGVPLADR